MLAINGRARDELKRILSSRKDSTQKIMRLITHQPGEFRLGMDLEKPGDHVIEHEGTKILLVDNGIAGNLGEYTLAFEGKDFIMAKGPLSGFNKSIIKFYEEKRKHDKLR